MVTRISSRGARPAAVSASTVFAIALAIVAGLIFAWLAKIVLFDKPRVVKPPDDSREVTVAATNVYDQMEIKSFNVKKIRVSRQQEADWAHKNGKKMLIGNQPVGRVARVPINAEEPFYEEDLIPFAYPESVDKRLRPGWRAVIVTIPAKEAMVQVNDYVDVYATLSNDALGAGGNGTAEIAKGAKVIARFGTTKPGAQPRDVNAPREYTLEVTPYRYALIELAKTVGAKFSMAVAPLSPPVEGDKPVPPEGNDINDPREQVAERVGGADLAALFGIPGPAQPGPAPWSIEKYVGIHPAGSSSYPGYVPPSRAGGGSAAPTTSGAESSRNRTDRAVPVAYRPAPRPGTTLPPPIVRTMPPPVPASRPSFATSGMVASSARSFGFGAPRDVAAERARACHT